MRSDIFRNIKQYKWKSMYFKYIFSYLGLAVIAYVGLISIFIIYFMPKMNELFTQKATQACRTNSAVLDYKIAEIYSAMNSLIIDDDVRNIIERPDLERPQFDVLQSMGTVAEFIAQKKRDSINITDIIVYNAKCNYAVTSHSSGFLDTLEEKAWKKHLESLDERVVFYFFYENEYYYICQKLYSGMIIIEMEDIFDANFINGKLYVFETRNNMLIRDYGSEKVSYRKMEQEFLSYIENNMIYVQIRGQNWFNYLYATPTFNIFSDDTFWSIVFLLGIFLLCVIVILSVYQTNKSYRHITNILALCDTDITLSHNEWVTISTHLINLTNKKNVIEKELLDKINQIKKYQNIALQTQLTPHFLFNTLHMINLSIQDTIHGDCKGTRMITQLSNFLRITLDTERTIICLEDELKHAESYLALEQMKYEKYLNIVWQIDHSCLKLQCPKLILQPLLENSITHGMKRDLSLTITVKVIKSQNHVIIIVMDNGAGIEDEQLKGIEERIALFPENKHIGMANVIKRLQLYYGEEFSYRIDTKVNQGTSVTLQIPQSVK